MNTISVLDKVQKPGIVSIDCGDGRFAHELDYHGGYSPDTGGHKSLVLDLASPLYSPGSKSKIYDRSLYGNHGAITEAVWKQVSSSGLWYLDFDKINDFIRVTDDSSLDCTEHLTIKVWVKPTAATIAAAQARIVDKWWDGATRAWSSMLVSGVPGFDLGFVEQFDFDTTLTADIWTHIVFSWNKTTAYCYINGVVEATTYAKATAIAANTANVCVGIFAADESSDDFGGGIALEVVIDGAWSAAQAIRSYQEERHLLGV